MRDGPVAQLEHLARHLGVATLVGLDQRPASQRVEVRRGDRGERHGGGERHAAAASAVAPAGRPARFPGRSAAGARGWCTSTCRPGAASGAMGRWTTRRPARTKSAGSQRCAPSKSGVTAGEPLERARAHHPCRTREIAEVRCEQQPTDPVREGGRHAPRPGVLSPDAHAARQIGVAQCIEETGQVLGVALEIGVEGGDQRRPRGGEAGAQRGRLSRDAPHGGAGAAVARRVRGARGSQGCRRRSRRRRRSAPRRCRLRRARRGPPTPGARGSAPRRRRGQRH